MIYSFPTKSCSYWQSPKWSISKKKKIPLRVNQHTWDLVSWNNGPGGLERSSPITVSFHCLLQPGLAPLCARLIGCVHCWAFFATEPYVTRKLQDCHCSAACFQMVQFLRQFTARPTLARDHCHKISKLRFWRKSTIRYNFAWILS